MWPPPPFRFAVVVVVSDDDKLRLRDGGGRALGINLTSSSSSSSHSSELLPGHRKRERERGPTEKREKLEGEESKLPRHPLLLLLCSCSSLGLSLGSCSFFLCEKDGILGALGFPAHLILGSTSSSWVCFSFPFSPCASCGEWFCSYSLLVGGTSVVCVCVCAILSFISDFVIQAYSFYVQSFSFVLGSWGKYGMHLDQVHPPFCSLRSGR